MQAIMNILSSQFQHVLKFLPENGCNRVIAMATISLEYALTDAISFQLLKTGFAESSDIYIDSATGNTSILVESESVNYVMQVATNSVVGVCAISRAVGSKV